MKSFLMIGQSNMAGRGFVGEVPPIVNEKLQMLRNGRWLMLSEPANCDRPVAGIGLAPAFSQLLAQDSGEAIGLIPCAEGGSSLDEWSPDKVLFRHAVAQTKFALETSELAGILWHQGESDSHQGQWQVYKEKLQVIITELRRQLECPHIPFLIGGLPDFLGKTGFGLMCSEYMEVNEQLKQFATEQENCYFVTAENLTANPDGIHLDAKSNRIFGIRYYEAYKQRSHILSPLPDEEEILQRLTGKDLTKGEKMYVASLEFGLGKITYEEFMARMG